MRTYARMRRMHSSACACARVRGGSGRLLTGVSLRTFYTEVYLYMNVGMHGCTIVCLCVCVCVCVCGNVTFIDIYLYIFAKVHIYTYVCMYVYIYMCVMQ
jgi:hypothetical protein